jgi:hypothetical protein
VRAHRTDSFLLPPTTPFSETLSESLSLPQPTRELAALVGAKLYFHLGSESDALRLALRAGPRFEHERLAVVDGKGKGNEGFVEVITAKALDSYIALRCSTDTSSSAAGGSSTHEETASLEAILLSIVRAALAKGESRHALGLALEARRTDLVRLVWDEQGREAALLKWVLEQVGNAGRGAGGRAFRVEVGSPPRLSSVLTKQSLTLASLLSLSLF